MTRRARLTVTTAGIIIGGAYVPPPPQPGSHAEAIQRALLVGPARRSLAESIVAAAARLFAAAVHGWQEWDLRACSARHRRLGYGRIQSIARALWCVL